MKVSLIKKSLFVTVLTNCQSEFLTDLNQGIGRFPENRVSIVIMKIDNFCKKKPLTVFVNCGHKKFYDIGL